MFKNSKNVLNYVFAQGGIKFLAQILGEKRKEKGFVVFFVDHFFQQQLEFVSELPISENDGDLLYFLDSGHEPTTENMDLFNAKIRGHRSTLPLAIVAIGGGHTLDTAKAVANLLTNEGPASSYQGWDLVKNKAVYKIGIPTLSGTGAEASRTCVMTNKKTGLKLGMNSDHTIYDQLILDPDLTATVPRNQFFYSAMDTYIHCMESLAGFNRHPVADAFSREAINLCTEVFSQNEMMTAENRSKIMTASLLGGMAIANSFVGVVHPFSAGLSVVLGLPHCLANCIVMRGMNEFYPEHFPLFWQMVERHKIEIPKLSIRTLSNEQRQQLYQSTIIHERPLMNALGPNFKKVLNINKVLEIFEQM